MNLSEAVFYGLWLIGVSWILFAFLTRVRRNLRLARIERQRRYLTEILDDILQVSDSSLRSRLLRLWTRVETTAHQAQSSQEILNALTKSLRETDYILETLAESNRSLLLRIIPKLIGIYYTGDFRIRVLVAALATVTLAWLAIRLLQMPFLSIVKESVETVQRLHHLRFRLANFGASN
ncbi:MAG: hypothetical protein ACK4I8_00115 [Armatimonadota bacterium]